MDYLFIILNIGSLFLKENPKDQQLIFEPIDILFCNKVYMFSKLNFILNLYLSNKIINKEVKKSDLR
jgi:hypothetical protein